MSADPFRKLKLAAQRQQQKNVAGVADAAAAAPSHPATQLIADRAIELTAAVAETAPANDAATNEDAQTPVTNSSASDQTEVVIEPQDDSMSMLWWAAKNVHTAKGIFYPPVPVSPVTIVGKASRESERYSADFDGIRKSGNHAGRNSVLIWMKSELARPRALAWFIGTVTVGLLSVNIFAKYRADSAIADAQSTKEAAVRHSLALLDPPQAPIPQQAPKPSTDNLPAAALTATSLDAYVQQALPQLTGAQPMPGRSAPTPASVQARPLPSVPDTSVAAATAPVTAAAMPKKAPIGDSIDDDTREISPAPSKVKRAKARHRSSDEDAIESNVTMNTAPGQDPLSGVMIRATIASKIVPFSVHEIRQQSDGWGAFVLPADSDDLGTGVWVKAGHVFPNGWQLVDITRQRIALLSPEGQIVTASPR